jgi:ribosome-associated toxin RatA of RatAB toxin-antitoxin module
MKKILFAILSLTLFTVAATFAAPRDFGAEGTNGLTEDQKKKLATGEIVFTKSISGDETKSALIQAALVFNQSPEKVWALLSRTEDQAKYLNEVEELQVIKKSATEDCIEFTLDVAFIELVYRVIHKFDRANLYFHWALDPTFDNSLNQLNGFWRFFPYGEGKTLARYGSNLSVSAVVPSFVENYMTRTNLPKALADVKKYVDSGGTWRK